MSKGLRYFEQKTCIPKHLTATEFITVTGRGLMATMSMKANRLTQERVRELRGKIVRIDGRPYRVKGVEGFVQGLRNRLADNIGLLISPIA